MPTAADIGAATAEEVNTLKNSTVPTSRTINGKALSDDISLTYSDVGAAAASHTHGSITASSSATTWMFDDDTNGVGLQVGSNSSNGTFNIRKVAGNGASIWDSEGKNTGTIYTTGNLTFSLSGTTLTITKS